MKFSFFLFFLILSVSLGCEKNETSQTIDFEDDLSNTYKNQIFDSSSIITSKIETYDSLVSYGVSSAYIGSYYDSILGICFSNLYNGFVVNISDTGFFKVNPVLYSTYLFLEFTNEFYGNVPNQAGLQEFEVLSVGDEILGSNELASLELSKQYRTFSSLKIDQYLGSKTFYPYAPYQDYERPDNTKVKLNFNEIGYSITRKNGIFIKLDNTFGQKFITYFNSTDFNKTSAINKYNIFISLIRGLLIRSKNLDNFNNNVNNGILTRINIPNSGVYVVYKSEGVPYSTFFNFSSSNNFISYNYDFSKSGFDIIDNPNSKYLPLTPSTKLIIKFNDLSRFYTRKTNIISAVLKLKIHDYNKFTRSYTPAPPRLSIFAVNSNNNIENIDDAVIYGLDYVGGYLSNIQNYRNNYDTYLFDITTFIRKKTINGTYSNYSLLIYITNGGKNPYRVVLENPALNPITSRLEVIYSNQ